MSPSRRPAIGLVIPTLVLLLASLAADAGPCVDCNADGAIDIRFRDDHVLPMLPLGGSATDPDVAVAGDRAMVAFVDDAVTATNPNGLPQVWVAWADGLGCAWQPPVQLTADAVVGSLTPAVTMTVDLAVVVYARGGQIFTRHAATASWPVLMFDAEEALSDLVASGVASDPDVSSLGPFVHVVWQGSSLGLAHVYYKRSLSRGMLGTYTGSLGSLLETDLTSQPGPPDFNSSNSTLPQVVADSFTPSATTSAVNLVFLNDNVTDNPVRSLYRLRSVNSGNSFYGDLASNPMPLKVDDIASANQPNAAAAALDSSDAGRGGAGNWSVALWHDLRLGGMSQNLFADTGYDDGNGPITPWTAPDIPIENQNPAGRDPAVTAQYLGGTSGEAFFYFTFNRMGGPEINFRRASLNPTAPTIAANCNLGMQGFARLTGIFPPRAAGNAQFAAAADAAIPGGGGEQFLAWVDTRAGLPEIWWKSTDSVPPGPVTGLSATPTTCPDTGFDIVWTPPSGECDLAGARVEYDDGTGPISVDIPAGTTTATVLGLKPSTLYTIRVYASDEACNESVASTTTATTPACITPVLAAVAPPAPTDECNVAGAPSDRNGRVEPNEVVTNVLLPLSNSGTGDATNITATLTGPPQVILGVDTSAYPDIAASGGPVDNLTPFSFSVRPAVMCGAAAIDLDFTLTVVSAELPGGVPLTYTFTIPATPNCEVCAANVQLQPAPPTFTDSCSGTGTGSGDGFPDPGEDLVALKLPVTQTTTMPPAPARTLATNVRVTALTSPTPGVTVVQGASTYNDITPGTTELNLTDFALQLDPAAFPCTGNGAPLQLDLFLAYDQAVNPVRLRYNLPTNDPACGACVPGSCPAPVPAVTLLQSVRQGNDVTMQWTREPSASAYNVWYVPGKAAIPDATAAGFVLSLCSAVPNCADTLPATTESCTHSGAVPPTPLDFYQVRALCAGTEGL